MQKLPDALSRLLAPFPERAVKGKMFWLSVGVMILFIFCCHSISISQRAEITRQGVAIAATISIGTLAITLASMAIFASLANDTFQQSFPEWGTIAGIFLWASVVDVTALLLQSFIFVLSFSDVVRESNIFFGIGCVSFFFFVYQLLLNVQCAHTILRTMLAYETLH